MMYGNRVLSFFGKLLSGLSEALIPVVWIKKQKTLRLETGLVHGVEVDDEYELLLFDVAESSSGNEISILLKASVSAVQSFTADMVRSEAGFFSAQSEERWKAKALTHISSKRINVQVMMEEHQANELIRLAKNTKFLSLFPTNPNQLCTFTVFCNDGLYQIRDYSQQRIAGLPAITGSQNGAPARVLMLLEQLSLFEFVEGLENRSPAIDFEQSIRLNLTNGRTGNACQQGVLDVAHGDILSLRLENFGEKEFFLSVLDLGPLWQIEDFLVDDCVLIPPRDVMYRGYKNWRFSMSVPDPLIKQGCKDIFKVFVTSQSISFSSLCVSRITATSDLVDSLRGKHGQLSQLLADLKGFLRGDSHSGANGAWATRSFIVCVTR